MTPDGNPTTKKSESIDYKLIQPTDNYGFVIEKSPYIRENKPVKPAPYPEFPDFENIAGDYTWSNIEW